MSNLSLREIAQSQLDSTPVIDGQLAIGRRFRVSRNHVTCDTGKVLLVPIKDFLASLCGHYDSSYSFKFM